MSYIVNKFDGTVLIVLEDGTLDTTTSVGLVGRNYIGYGETQNENFVYLLENFASGNPPTKPLEGQGWFNKVSKQLNVYNGTDWVPVSAASVGSIPPVEAEGQLWYKITTEQLYVFSNDRWNLIGPEAIEGFGETKWKARSIRDLDNNNRPILVQVIDDEVTAISTNSDFTINPTDNINGFFNLKRGINLKTDVKLTGNVTGNALTASSLEIPRSINGTSFDGTTDISVKASTPGTLVAGTYLRGESFDGSKEVEWSVEATPINVIGSIVARDSQGNFSAGVITADLLGDVQGNVTSVAGVSSFNEINSNIVRSELIGNASTANQLRFDKTINGVIFNGSQDITITSAADTLTTNTLASNVINSSLNTVGVLSSLVVASPGVTIGTESQLKVFLDGAVPTIKIDLEQKFRTEIKDTSRLSGRTDISFIPSNVSQTLNGPARPAFIPEETGTTTGVTNLGHPFARWNTLYVNNIEGFIVADELKGGARGSIPYQAGVNDTTMLPVGAQGQVLRVGASDLPAWSAAGSTNVANSMVVRDANGNFTAGTITATLNGNASSSNTTTRLATPRSINGIPFDGSQNITIPVPGNYTITYGNTVYSIAGFTNQVGSWNNGANFFDVFPPSGRSMADLVGFIPSIAVIHYAGGVNGDDSMRCTWANIGDRIRVWVQNTEQRSTPAANYLAIWR